MPEYMLKRAMIEAYGQNTPIEVSHVAKIKELERQTNHKIKKKKNLSAQEDALKFQLGDSVIVMPDKKIGIICETANEKGMLRVQMAYGKIWVNHKRLKRNIVAEKLYPENYDFSILFDSVEKRKAQHNMKRKFVQDTFQYDE